MKDKGIVIETERLILRNLRLSDAEAMFEYCSSPNVGPHAGWRPYKDIDDVKSWIKRHKESPLLFGIVWKENNKVIGQIDLNKTKIEDFSENVSENSMKLGYVLSEKYWGKGIMPEAVSALADYAFTTLNLDQIVSRHAEPNFQSARVQEKMGFKVFGTQKNSFTWVDGTKVNLVLRKLTKEEWQKVKQKENGK